MKNKPLWAVLITIVLVIVIGSAVIGSLREQNWFSLLIKAAAKAMPFGNELLKYACKLVERYNGIAPKISSLIDQQKLKPLDVIQEVTKLIFSGILLDFLKELCEAVLNAKKNSGNARDKVMYVVCTFFAVILSSLGAGIIMTMIKNYLSGTWGMAAAVAIVLAALAAGVIVAHIKYPGRYGFFYIGLKYFGLNVVIVTWNNFIIMMLLSLAQEGVSLGRILGVSGGFLAILLMLAGLALAVDSVVFKSWRS